MLFPVFYVEVISVPVQVSVHLVVSRLLQAGSEAAWVDARSMLFQKVVWKNLRFTWGMEVAIRTAVINPRLRWRSGGPSS